ncbi:MAG TPA: 50S ribosomal protein L15 [Candidatus Magasanikbacteria bacterium]|nr:MAG: 50S ribosomal protein L15 [Candidatus Magasanikbacteria bacterium RIFCSPLOWO2_02_FULL_47_16]OGH79315.1 MAG: 50S ribosomal protein L15 [Candidatus Magasanikbacteria bacterium RIFCSPHIGHO2_02_FULL_48_18]OGH81891.1 MAG: 50S ribosomal protein L15 [Candidatus Magasanikbacteria bacterium RIFCSPLOWO2_12_FULL_47_9b]HAZ28425.1 50S ribosomal protein L15 [Candidatus Magasanikbacteria bacterium]
MTLQAHTIHPAQGSKRKTKRVGRGNSSGKGTYSARGLKGQRARSGGKAGGQRRGFKKALQKVPKSRGFHSAFVPKQTISLSVLEKKTVLNDVVSPQTLKEKRLIARADRGVKIVATGTLTHAVTVRDCLLSKKAITLIEKAGGKVVF